MYRPSKNDTDVGYFMRAAISRTTSALSGNFLSFGDVAVAFVGLLHPGPVELIKRNSWLILEQ